MKNGEHDNKKEEEKENPIEGRNDVMDTCDHNMTNTEIQESDSDSTLTKQSVRFADLIRSEEEMDEVD